MLFAKVRLYIPWSFSNSFNSIFLSRDRRRRTLNGDLRWWRGASDLGRRLDDTLTLLGRTTFDSVSIIFRPHALSFRPYEQRSWPWAPAIFHDCPACLLNCRRWFRSFFPCALPKLRPKGYLSKLHLVHAVFVYFAKTAGTRGPSLTCFLSIQTLAATAYYNGLASGSSYRPLPLTVSLTEFGAYAFLRVL